MLPFEAGLLEVPAQCFALTQNIDPEMVSWQEWILPWTSNNKPLQ